MSRPFIKTLTFALCATIVGASTILATTSAMPASALEIQYDYCKDFTDSEQHAICESALTELQQFDREDLLEINKAAVAAVEQQIPKFNALKEVPYARGLALAGSPCGTSRVPETNQYDLNCGPWSAKMVLAAKLANVSGDLDVVGSNRTWQTLMSKTFEALIDLGKNDARYTSDDEFRTAVDNSEQNYTVGMALLREAVLYFDESAEVNSMTAAELIATLEALPEYDLYNLEYYSESDDPEAASIRYSTGLYNTYSDAKYAALHEQEVRETDYGDAGIYYSVVRNYAWLVTAATTVDPNFKIDLSQFQDAPASVPTAPNAGSKSFELAGTITKVDIFSAAGLAAIVGIIMVVKHYLFSPLKHK